MGAIVTRLFFHAYDHQRPLGGQKHTYAQVDALVAHGVDAQVVHAREGFRLTWFANETPVIGPEAFARLHDPDRDLLVLPEDLGDRIATVPGRKVIFNKSVHNGFRALDLDDRRTPYERADVVAALAVSEHDATILRFAFPALPVHVTRPGIDVDRFAATPLRDRPRQVAFATKNPSALAMLRHVLASRARQGHNRLADSTWIAIAGLTEDEVIVTLRASRVFVFLGTEDGFGLLPREAALCGCVTVAFDGGTIDELSPRGRVVPGDVIGAARLIEDVTGREPSDLGAWQAEVDSARVAVARGSVAAAAQEAAAAWDAILATI